MKAKVLSRSFSVFRAHSQTTMRFQPCSAHAFSCSASRRTDLRRVARRLLGRKQPGRVVLWQHGVGRKADCAEALVDRRSDDCLGRVLPVAPCRMRMVVCLSHFTYRGLNRTSACQVPYSSSLKKSISFALPKINRNSMVNATSGPQIQAFQPK